MDNATEEELTEFLKKVRFFSMEAQEMGLRANCTLHCHPNGARIEQYSTSSPNEFTMNATMKGSEGNREGNPDKIAATGNNS